MLGSRPPSSSQYGTRRSETPQIPRTRTSSTDKLREHCRLGTASRRPARLGVARWQSSPTRLPAEAGTRSSCSTLGHTTECAVVGSPRRPTRTLSRVPPCGPALRPPPPRRTLQTQKGPARSSLCLRSSVQLLGPLRPLAGVQAWCRGSAGKVRLRADVDLRLHLP